VRSAGAILAGLVAVVALSTGADLILHASGVYPPLDQPMQANGLFLLALAYRSAFAVLGCWIAARIAPSAPMRHALILGGIGFLLSCVGLAASMGHPEMGPIWYPAALVVTALPCAWLGGWLARPRA
jgi:hypothetical protein